MFRNRRGITGLALAALWSIAVPVAIAQTPASPIVIKFSNVNTANSPKNLAADYFKKLAEERTKGRVKIEIYPNSVLYKDKEELEALQLGSVQMLAPTLGKFGPLGLKEFEVFDLPYLFENYEQVHKVTEGPIGQKLLRSMGSKKILGLAFWDNGFKQMNANRPLRMPDDFRGLKVRIFSSKVLDAQFRAVGAIPQVLAASEMYQAMQTGLVDGNENTESTFYQFKLFEVQKYLTLSNHGYVGYAVVVNKEFWEGLPADIREILEQAMKEATVYNNQITEKENREALEGIRKTGKTEVITLTPEQKAAWKKAMGKSHADTEARVGKELLEAIYRETGTDPRKL